MKRVKLMITVLLPLILLMLSGCVRHTELDKMAIVEVMGIDRSEVGYTVSLQYFNMEKSGGNAIIDESGTNVIRVSADGRSVGEAVSNAESLSGKRITLGGLGFIILGEGTVNEQLLRAVALTAEQYHGGPSIYVTAAQGKASDIVDIKFKEGFSSFEKLKNIMKTAEEKGECAPLRLYEAVQKLCQPTKSLVLPLMSVREDEGTQEFSEDKKSAVISGGLLYTGGRVAAQLSAEEMSGLALFYGKVETLELFSSKLYDISSVISGSPSQDGSLKVTADISAACRSKSADMCSEEIARRVALFYENVIKKYGADVCGLRYSLSHRYSDTKEYTQLLQASDIAVNVSLDTERF